MRLKFALLMLVVMLFVYTGTGAAETEQLIPNRSIAHVTISEVQKDAGLNWLLDSWIHSPRKSPLRRFFSSNPPGEMSVAVFPQEGTSSLSLLLAVELSGKKKIDNSVFDAIILSETEAVVNSITYKNHILRFVSTEDTNEEFSAYTVWNDKVLVGTNMDVLKYVVDGPAMVQSAGYKNVRSMFPKDTDGFLFADNENLKFARFLHPLEDKWKMSLLLSAEYLDWMGAAFDVVDSTRVNGQFVFKGKDTSHIDDIRDDAEFLGEAFKRKFMAEKIDYSSSVEVDGSTVVLDFKIAGIKPLWEQLFEQGVLSVIRPE
jgi:hypothetical protein